MAGQRLTDKSSLNNHTGSGDLYMVVDVSDTTGSAAGTSKKLDSKFVIQTDKISVSSAEFQAMDSSGSAGKFKTLVSAPGSGYGVMPISVIAVCTYVSATDNASRTLFAGYDPSALFYWKQKQRFMHLQAGDRVFAVDYVAATTVTQSGTIDNEAFRLWSSGNFNGDFTADVYVTYQIIKLG